MSHSPPNYGFEGDPNLEAYMNAKYSEEISSMMSVPKKISANGYSNEHEILNGNEMNSWNYHEKLNMTVPDRIVVMGQDQHLGIRNFLKKNQSQPFLYLISFSYAPLLPFCYPIMSL